MNKYVYCFDSGTEMSELTMKFFSDSGKGEVW